MPKESEARLVLHYNEPNRGTAPGSYETVRRTLAAVGAGERPLVLSLERTHAWMLRRLDLFAKIQGVPAAALEGFHIQTRLLQLSDLEDLLDNYKPAFKPTVVIIDHLGHLRPDTGHREERMYRTSHDNQVLRALRQVVDGRGLTVEAMHHVNREGALALEHVDEVRHIKVDVSLDEESPADIPCRCAHPGPGYAQACRASSGYGFVDPAGELESCQCRCHQEGGCE